MIRAIAVALLALGLCFSCWVLYRLEKQRQRAEERKALAQQRAYWVRGLLPPPPLPEPMKKAVRARRAQEAQHRGSKR